MFTSKSRKKIHKAGHSCELMSSYDVVPLVGFKTTRVQKVHSRILLYLSYSGCSRKADTGTIAIGLVCRVSYRAFLRYSDFLEFPKLGIFWKIGYFSL